MKAERRQPHEFARDGGAACKQLIPSTPVKQFPGLAPFSPTREAVDVQVEGTLKETANCPLMHGFLAKKQCPVPYVGLPSRPVSSSSDGS